MVELVHLVQPPSEVIAGDLEAVLADDVDVLIDLRGSHHAPAAGVKWFSDASRALSVPCYAALPLLAQV